MIQEFISNMGFGLVLILAGIVLVGYLVGIYNSLIQVRHQIDKAWKNIDVLLKQRTDELTKLIDTVKGHMKYESETLKELTAARTMSEKAKSVKAKQNAADQVSNAMKGFWAVAENYPQLRASESFLHLENRISSIEEQIADRREFYNDAVYTFNMRLQQIPYSFFAGMMHYEKWDYYHVSEEDKKDVKISFD